MNYKTVSEMFVGTTNRCSEKKLFYYKKNNDWVGLSGKDILITVEDISFGLRSLGVTANSNIAIISNNSPKWAMCDYGIVCSTMSTVTIYPTLIANQVEFILQNSNSNLIFVENQEQYEKVNSVKSNCPDLKFIVVLDDSCTEESESVMNFVTFLDKGKDFSQDCDFTTWLLL